MTRRAGIALLFALTTASCSATAGPAPPATAGAPAPDGPVAGAAALRRIVLAPGSDVVAKERAGGRVGLTLDVPLTVVQAYERYRAAARRAGLVVMFEEFEGFDAELSFALPDDDYGFVRILAGTTPGRTSVDVSLPR
jgi:hypothetical protein